MVELFKLSNVSEAVSSLHPDKVADRFSDIVLEMIKEVDNNALCGIETLIKDDFIYVAGEVKTTIEDLKPILEYSVVKLNQQLPKSYRVKSVYNHIGTQSAEINQAVVKENEIGAGDQGFVYGYSNNYTTHRLPFLTQVATDVIEILEKARIKGEYNIVGDAKSQAYFDEENVLNIVVSAQHSPNISVDDLRNKIIGLLASELKLENYNGFIRYNINPAGAWTIGGAFADAGLTGRKIVADQYGGGVPVGGGAFSGKDYTKVDRSGAYAMRLIANTVMEKFKYEIKEVLIEAAYVIGVKDTVSLKVKTDSPYYNEQVENYIRDNFDLSVKGLIALVENNLDITFSELAKGNHMRKITQPIRVKEEKE